jgi:hypothetical protein
MSRQHPCIPWMRHVTIMLILFSSYFLVATNAGPQTPAEGGITQVEETSVLKESLLARSAPARRLSQAAGEEELQSVLFEPEIRYAGSHQAGQPVNITLQFSVKAINGLMPNDNVIYVLPKFSRGSDAPWLDVEGELRRSFTAAWYEGKKQLILTCMNEVQNAFVVLHISSVSGISLPRDGIIRNDPTLIVSTNAVKGPLKPTSIPISPPVGSFTSTPSVSYGVPLAGNASDITLSLTPQMSFLQGETVTLTLMDFKCQAKANCTQSSFSITSVPTGAFASASWRTGTSEIVMTAARAVAERAQIAFRIPLAAGIQLPESGLSAGDSRLMVSSSAASGPVMRTTVTSSPPVGVFLQKSISFSLGTSGSSDLPLAGKAVPIVLKFALSHTMAPGEQIRLRLPGFLRNDFIPTVFQVNHPVFTTALWYRGTEEVVLTATKYWIARDIATVALQREDQIRLPGGGVVVNDPMIQLSTNALAGPVMYTPIANNPPVGQIFATSLTFDPMSAGDPTQLTLSFTPSMELKEYDSVYLQLEGFLGPDVVAIGSGELLGGNGIASPFHAVWSQTDPDQTLIFALGCGQTIPAYQRVTIVVPSSSNIKLPIEGIKSATAPIYISASSVNGQVPPTPVLGLSNVGGFDDIVGVRLRFTPAAAGAVSQIDITFQPTMSILPGETVSLKLPGFFAVEGDCESRTSALVRSIYFLRATWNATRSELSLTAHQTVDQKTFVEVSVPSNFGLSLPLNGLKQNQQSLLVGSNAASGPVSFQPITANPALTVLDDPTVDFDPPRVNANVSIKISFRAKATSSRQIQYLEVISIILPQGFRRAINSPVVFVNGSSRIPSARWNANTSVLDLQISQDLPAQQFDLLIPASQGFSLPDVGLRKGQVQYYLDLRLGPSEPTPMLLSHSVGAFMPGMSIEFVHPFVAVQQLSAGQLVSMRIEFTTTMDVVAGESVTLTLPLFTGEKSELSSEDFASQQSLRIRWSQHDQQLNMTLQSGSIKAYQLVQIIIRPTSSIKLPATGLKLFQGDITVESKALAGLVLPTWIPVSPAVGSFTTSTRVSWGINPRAGAVTNVTLAFRPEMQIARGEQVRLVLPSFTGPAGSPLKTTAQSLFQTTWDSSSETIVFSVLRNILRGERVEVTILTDPGMVVPLSGVPQNWDIITISTDAADGPVPPTAVTATQGIGTFSKFEMDFTPPWPSTASQIRVRFSLAATAGVNDTIILSLPRFTSVLTTPSIQELQTNTINGIKLRGVWYANTEQLYLTCIQGCPIAPRTEVVVEVAASNGLVLPADGLRPNQQTLTVMFLAASAPVLVPQSVMASQTVGFVQASLAFRQTNTPRLHGGRFTTIDMSFSYSAPISRGDSVSITLPGFRGVDGLIPISGASSSRFGSIAQWSPANEAISFNISVQAGIQALETVTISFSQDSANMTLTTRGVAQNQGLPFGITVASVSTGRVTWPFYTLQEIPGFQTARLFLSPQIPGSLVNMTLSTSFSSRLPAGNIVSLRLPGFTGTMKQSFIVRSVPLGLVETASWGVQANTLQMTVARNINASLQFDVVITSSSSGISLPTQGVPKSDLRIIIRSDGWTDDLPVDFHSSVGVFSNTELLYAVFANGTLSRLSVQFTLNTTISRGDSITVRLSGWSSNRSDISVMNNTQGDANTEFSARWDQSQRDLVLTYAAAQDIAAGRTVKLYFLPGTFTLPASPLQGPLTISTNASAGEVSPVPFTAARSVSVTAAREELGHYEASHHLSRALLAAQQSAAAARSLLASRSSGSSPQVKVERGDLLGQSSWTLVEPAMDKEWQVAAAPARASISASGHADRTSADKNMASVQTPYVMDPEAGSQNSRRQLSTPRSSINYVPFVAGRIVSLVLTFTVNAAASKFDAFLPHMSRILANDVRQTGCFAASTDSECKFSVKIDSASVLSGIWYANTSRLEFFARTTLAVGTVVNMTIGESERFAVQDQGVASNRSDVRIDGIQIERQPALGSFLKTATVSFNPPIAGSPTGITVTFAPLMELLPGETVIFNFPNFSGVNKPSINVTNDAKGANGTTAPVRVASWASGLVAALTLTAARKISAGEFCIVTVDPIVNRTILVGPATLVNMTVTVNGTNITNATWVPGKVTILIDVLWAGPVINARGVRPNSPDVQISSQAVAGNVLPIRVFMSQGVGAIIPPSVLDFDTDPESPAVVTTLKFTPAMALYPKDIVVLALPGFTGDATNCVIVTDTHPMGVFTLSDWSQDTHELALTVSAYTPPEQEVRVTIPGAAGIVLPEAGLEPNQQSLTIAIYAREGLMSATPFSQSPPIGSFKSISLDYAPAMAGKTTQLTLRCIPQMRILPHELVFLTLPDFRFPNRTSIMINSEPLGTFTTALITGSTLVFPAQTILEKGQSTVVVVPFAAGISIPVNGLRANQGTLQIKTDASGGPVPGLPITRSQPIGAFPLSYVSYEPLEVGKPVSVIMTFAASMAIGGREVVNFTLTGFSAGKSVADVQAFSSRTALTASWSESTATFSLTALNTIPAKDEVTVYLKTDFGMKLPPAGVSANDESLIITTNANDGPVLPTPIQYSPAVGFFQIKELEFYPPLADMPADVSIKIKSIRAIAGNETVIITLGAPVGCPFDLQTGPVSTAGEGSSKFPTAYIDSENNEIVLTAGTTIVGGTELTVIIPKNTGVPGRGGIRLPACGVSADQAEIFIETAAVAGPVARVGMKVQSIGAFWDTRIQVRICVCICLWFALPLPFLKFVYLCLCGAVRLRILAVHTEWFLVCMCPACLCFSIHLPLQ